MANAFLSSYLESINSVPGELQRNFNMMHDLDQRVEDLLSEIQDCQHRYLTTLKTNTDKSKCLSEIKEKFDQSHAYSDDKVQLAMQTYEMVDKHIRRLDTDLQRLEAKQRSSEKTSESRMFVDKRSDNKKSGDQTALPFSLISGAGEGLDMPVDPNEPTYCLCHQVSYGEMIGCDNTDCPVEWFHFACVGLTSKPKGNWFCPRCSKDIGK